MQTQKISKKGTIEMDKRANIVIQETLNMIGMPHHLKGYRYLLSAISKCLDDRTELDCIVKGLYVKVAEENGDTVTRAERAIRNAIEVSWTRGNAFVINNIFGYTVSCIKGRPTNSEFIAMVTDFISIHFDEIEDGTYRWK